MRVLFIATAAIALGAAVPALAEPVTNWQGFYVGINGGYGGNEFKYPFNAVVSGTAGNSSTTNTTVTGSASQTSGGPIGGGQVGYNFAMPNWVLGVEADIDGSGIEGKDRISGSGGNTSGSGALNASIGSQIDYLGTVRVRIGAPLLDGRFMPYVSGGLAYGRVKSVASFNGSGLDIGNVMTESSTSSTSTSAGSISTTRTRTGWTLGVGADYALAPRWSFRAEYLYADLGTDTLLSGSGSGSLGSIVSGSVNGSLRRQTTANIVRVALNYHIGG